MKVCPEVTKNGNDKYRMNEQNSLVKYRDITPHYVRNLLPVADW